VIRKKHAKLNRDGVIWCRRANPIYDAKWLNIYYPIVTPTGRDLVLPAGIDFNLEGRIDEYDPISVSEAFSINMKPGEIRSLTLIADKKERW